MVVDVALPPEDESDEHAAVVAALEEESIAADQRWRDYCRGLMTLQELFIEHWSARIRIDRLRDYVIQTHDRRERDQSN